MPKRRKVRVSTEISENRKKLALPMHREEISRFKHDCVIYIDRWQNEDLGKVEVTDRFIEFVSDHRHLILDIDTLQEVRIELNVVKIFDTKQEKYFLKFLKRPPYRKWYSNKTYYDNDELSSRNFVSLVYSIIKSRKVAPGIKEKVVIKELVMTPCKYCGTLIPQTAIICPKCGARKE